MKIYCRIDENYIIRSVSNQYLVGENNGVSIDLSQDDYARLLDSIGRSKLIERADGTYDFEFVEMTSEEKDALENDEITNRIIFLRNSRSRDCFPIINRGAPWYNRLSAEEKAELDSWYRAWLDVTFTLEIPQPPSWLK